MISFIILTWNSEKFIANCIESIMILGLEKEIIVIDNGSSDSTSTILNSYKDIVKIIQLDKNYGTTYPRNVGIKSISSNSKYICVLDSDTVIRNGSIERLIKVLDNNEDIGLASPFLYYADGTRQISYKKLPTVQLKLFKAIPIKTINKYAEKLEHIEIDESLEYNMIEYAISACWLLKRDVVERVGLLDENIFYAPEDVDYCLRIWEHGYKLVIVSDTYVTHFTQRISKKRIFSKMNLEHIKGLLYYFHKHNYFFNPGKIIRRNNPNSII